MRELPVTQSTLDIALRYAGMASNRCILASNRSRATGEGCPGEGCQRIWERIERMGSYPPYPPASGGGEGR